MVTDERAYEVPDRDRAPIPLDRWDCDSGAVDSYADQGGAAAMRPRLLDLFCGGGGAAEGYARAGWDVVGIDIDPQPAYPYAFVEADAMEVLKQHLGDYDAIHASPPCQPYSKAVSSSSSEWNDTKGKDEPALIEPLRELLLATGLPYVIENVMAAPLDGIVLCGSMFGLDIPRHRRFESNKHLSPLPHPNCHGIAKAAAERRGWEYRDMSVTGKGRHAGWGERARELLGIEHPMRQHDYKEAIPPAYTEHIGRQLKWYVPAYAKWQADLRWTEEAAL